MFDLLKRMPKHKRLLYNKATLTYKALNGLTPEYITNMLTLNSQVNDRPLISSVDGTLMVPRSRTSLYDKSLESVSAPKYWNSLPNYINTAPSLSSFQTNLKDKLMHFLTSIKPRSYAQYTPPVQIYTRGVNLHLGCILVM